MQRERGSALITVILVVLVLTMVGIAGMLYMTVEDRLSSNDQQLKAAMYAAEAGLRVGERSINDQATANMAVLTTMLAYTSGSVAAYAPPGGGYSAVILSSAYGGSGTEFYHQGLSLPVAGGTLRYSLYVRNNEDDTSSSPVLDGDKKINLISVGEFQTGTGRTFQRVLEEQMFAGGAGGLGGLQKGGNAGSTGSKGISGRSL